MKNIPEKKRACFVSRTTEAKSKPSPRFRSSTIPGPETFHISVYRGNWVISAISVVGLSSLVKRTDTGCLLWLFQGVIYRFRYHSVWGPVCARTIRIFQFRCHKSGLLIARSSELEAETRLLLGCRANGQKLKNGVNYRLKKTTCKVNRLTFCDIWTTHLC